jgi:DNA-directed RNA polymerase subunit M/transcription elongation factor TFIIS
MNKGHRKRGPFENNEAPAKPEEPEVIPEGMKRCSHCGKILPVTEFRKHKGSPDGLQYACKTCQVEMTTKAKQKRTEEKKERIREAQKELDKERILSGQPEILNNLNLEIEAVPSIHSATDAELVEELKKRGYTGNLIRKTSFIL